MAKYLVIVESPAKVKTIKKFLAEQVMTLCAANGRVMLDVPVDHVKDFQMQFLSYMKEQHSDIVRQLETTKALDDELNKQICDAAEEFKKEFLQK